MSLGPSLLSSDGLTWTTSTSGTLHDLAAIAWTGTHFAVVGEKGFRLSSPDGITWIQRSSGTTKTLHSAVTDGITLLLAPVRGALARRRSDFFLVAVLPEDLIGRRVGPALYGLTGRRVTKVIPASFPWDRSPPRERIRQPRP